MVRQDPRIELLEHTEVTSLLVEAGRVAGVVVMPRGGESYAIHTPAVVVATGGVGQLYAVTTNPKVATADGWALAHRVGAKLRDLEFLQFHPTALKLPDVNPAPLISEAVRGAGAPLVDRDGRRFALDVDPRAELAPRDIVARAVAAADAAGGAWLDARQVDDFPGRFPGITAMLTRYGLDPARDLLPVAPALHYAMGGIQTDLEGRASLPGLWAVGEVASTGVHGANRLASNSLLEGLVFADRAGRAVAAARPATPHETGARGARRARLRRRRRLRADPAGDARADDGRRGRPANRGLAASRRAGPGPPDAGNARRGVAHPQSAPRGAADHPGRPPPPREPGRPSPARLSACRAQAGDRVTLSLPVIEQLDETPEEIAALQAEIHELARRRNAVVLAHNYQRAEVQDVADYVGDSLGLSRQAAKTPAEVIIFAGVHFMAETAAILSPTKRVLLPDLKAGCSLAATVTAEDVRRWKAKFPDYIAVGYVNTTAEVKAELDYCCTSGNVLDVIDAIPEDRGILFLPDFFLGAHVRRMRPHRRVEVWMGECHVHKGIRAETLNAAREEFPDAEVLVHPECGCAGQLIYEMGRGDIKPEGLHIASTEGMIRAVTERPAKRFIIATETGIMHRMRQMAPDKQFIAADPEAECAFMKTITLTNVRDSLALDRYHITVPDDIAARARGAIDRMVALGK